MSPNQQVWRISLDAPPVLYAIGIGVHGGIPSERYRLNGLWCVHFYRYAGEALIGGAVHPIRPGSISLTPPDTELEHRWLHPGSAHISVHFTALSGGDDAGTPIRAMQDCGEMARPILEQLEQALRFFPTYRARAALRVWEVLWQMSDLNQDISAAMRPHPAVERCVALIEARLHEPISVAGLAAEVEISHNHLIRLFQAAFGMPVREYILGRKLDRAEYLLRYSTLPIKAVAAQVGLPDLQHFNKLIRRARGRSPRAVRESRGS